MMGPVELFFVGMLLFGLGAVVGLMSARDTYQPPKAPDPRGHVRHVHIGTCRECGSEGVRVHLYRPHPLLDPDDVCDGCLRVLAGEAGLTGGAV